MTKPASERRAYHRAYAKEHQAERTIYMRGYRKKKYDEMRAQILLVLGGRCANCGITDERVLTIDHREGGGNGHRKGASGKSQSTLVYHRQVLDNLDAFRLLCWNCNWLAHRYGVST